MTELLNMVGAVATMMMGAMGLFAPKTAAAFVGLKPVTPAGQSEFRATFGGLFIGLGLIPFLTMDPVAYLVAACCWMGSATGRSVSIIIDKTATSKNLTAVGFESLFAVLLIVGAPWNVVF